jgi:YHS domain-containing protein
VYTERKFILVKKSLAVFAAAIVVLGASAAFARPDVKNVSCPIMKEKVAKPSAKMSSAYKGKTFYFCCGGCKPTFDKMSDKDKVALMKYGVDDKKPAPKKPTTPAKPAKKAAK